MFRCFFSPLSFNLFKVLCCELNLNNPFGFFLFFSSSLLNIQGLQTCVQSTKKAGREFPSVAAVQGMLDSVLAVSKLAQNLKTCLVTPIIQNGSKWIQKQNTFFRFVFVENTGFRHIRADLTTRTTYIQFPFTKSELITLGMHAGAAAQPYSVFFLVTKYCCLSYPHWFWSLLIISF